MADGPSAAEVDVREGDASGKLGGKDSGGVGDAETIEKKGEQAIGNSTKKAEIRSEKKQGNISNVSKQKEETSNEDNKTDKGTKQRSDARELTSSPKDDQKRTRTMSVGSATPPKEKRRRSTSSDNNDAENAIREKSVSLLSKSLGDGVGAQDVAKKVEEAIFEEFGDANDHRYRSRVRSRIVNLNRNSSIVNDLLKGVLSPTRFAKMTPEEMATPKLKELREHLSEESFEEHMLPEKERVGEENTKKSDNAVSL